MAKTYTSITNDQRRELIKLIHKHGLSIARAAEILGIFYPTAKAINKVYLREKRIVKRTSRIKTLSRETLSPPVLRDPEMMRIHPSERQDLIHSGR
jgi:molybdenum-dependent DNA-binding transcriptional regulator ModE